MEYLTNCIDGFDLDGDCILSLLPWSTVSDFALTIEQLGDNFTLDGIRCIYDAESDVHSFYLLFNLEPVRIIWDGGNIPGAH